MPSRKTLWKINGFLTVLLAVVIGAGYLLVIKPMRRTELPVPDAYTSSAEPHIVKAEAAAAASPEEVWSDDGAAGAADFTLPETVTEEDGSIGTITIPAVGIQMEVFETDDAMEDIGTLIANGHTYASGKNMGVNSSLTIGNAGYFNPVDITVRSQDSAQSDIYYCIDQIAGMMGTVEQDHPPVYNIVQDGSKIYVLYG